MSADNQSITLDIANDVQGVVTAYLFFFFSSIDLPVIPAISTCHTHPPGGRCQFQTQRLQYDVLLSRWFQWQWRKTCGTVCRRTTRVVKRKMGHRRKHQRDQAIVSPSKYTEFSFLWLNTDTQRDGEWHNHALERHIFSCLCDKLLMPSCCRSVYCILKWRMLIRHWQCCTRDLKALSLSA